MRDVRDVRDRDREPERGRERDKDERTKDSRAPIARQNSGMSASAGSPINSTSSKLGDAASEISKTYPRASEMWS
jgi:hypothetical protein